MAKVLNFAGGCGARCVARQSAFAGLEELLGPAVIHRGGDAFAAAKLGDALLPAQSFQDDTNILSAEYCRRVWRRMFFSTCSAGALSGPDFCSSSLLAATMNQKSSLREVPQFVSEVLSFAG